ncbi:MAG TPA: HlyD family secretion protein [Stenotrophomonas sp.]|jgi:multidrug resistance efflux pump
MGAIALLALCGVAVVLYAWRLPPFTSAIQSTENAMVRGQLTIIAPQVSGYVVDVPVRDFQRVEANQLLARIDDRIYGQQLEQARAQLQTAQANLANWDQSRRSAAAVIAENRAGVANSQAQQVRSQAALRRAEQLAGQQLLSEQDRDTAQAANAQARASLQQSQAALEAAEQSARSVEVNRGALEAAVANAEAAVQLAQINFDNTRIRAPRAGTLGQIGVRLGAYVTNGTQLMGLVPDTLWVIANFKETQLYQVRVGQRATFTVDALNNARLQGHVQEISPAAGSEFAVLPADNATGNFVKIAQRIPVKIGIDPGQPAAARLSPGMSVVVGVDTASDRDTQRNAR